MELGRSIFYSCLLGKLLQLLTCFSLLTPYSACLVYGRFAVCLCVWRFAGVCYDSSCSSSFHSYTCSHPCDVSGNGGFPSADQLLSDSLLFHCFLFGESGNSIWNNIFFPVALPSNFGTWNVYPVISKNLPWLFYPGKRFLLSFSIWNMSNSDQGGTKSTLPEKCFYFLPNKF